MRRTLAIARQLGVATAGARHRTVLRGTATSTIKSATDRLEKTAKAPLSRHQQHGLKLLDKLFRQLPSTPYPWPDGCLNDQAKLELLREMAITLDCALAEIDYALSDGPLCDLDLSIVLTDDPRVWRCRRFAPPTSTESDMNPDTVGERLTGQDDQLAQAWIAAIEKELLKPGHRNPNGEWFWVVTNDDLKRSSETKGRTWAFDQSVYSRIRQHFLAKNAPSSKFRFILLQEGDLGGTAVRIWLAPQTQTQTDKSADGTGATL